ncbi:MAG: T9SS type A sorting domain-containing protein [Bacteroidetes bacterium]|nr:MAG: T9SS type A sorting domain-containing protein [Bacteroidota bacterium]
MNRSAAGNSAVTINYSHRDEDHPQKAVLYYRLKLVDIDGRYEYSKVLRLRFRAGSFYINRIYPQPSQDMLHIDLTNVGVPANCIVSFIALSGAMIKQTTTVLNRGDNIIDINISSLPRGSYVMKVTNGETEVVEKLVR